MAELQTDSIMFSAYLKPFRLTRKAHGCVRLTWKAMMFLCHLFKVRVGSESGQSHKIFVSESSKILSSRDRDESWLARVRSVSNHKNCRVTSSHWFASSSQCLVKWNLTFFMSVFCYEMAPDKLKNCAQCCFSKFDWTLFMSTFF